MAKRSRVKMLEDAGAVHVYPLAEEHEMTPECWCEPEVDMVTEQGVAVWVHHEKQ